MSLRRDLRRGRRIGRAELRRSLRSYGRDARRLVGLALGVLLLGAPLLLSLPLVHALGRAARADPALALAVASAAATTLPPGLLVVVALRTVERLGGLDAGALLLTATHPRAVVVGLVVAEVGRLSLWLGTPAALVVATFSLGAGSPTLPATLALVALPPVVAVVAWGYAVGVGALLVLRRLPTVRRVLKGAVVLALAATVVLVQVAAPSAVAGVDSPRALLSSVAAGPLADYAALAFVGTPLAGAVPVTGAVVLVGWLALAAGGLAAATRAATALWLTDDPDPGSAPAGVGGSTAAGGGFSPPRPFDRHATGRVAWAVLTRAVRNPGRLAHLLTLAFLAGPLAGGVVRTAHGGLLPPLAAGAGVAVGAYLSGATFSLNPLGDDRPHLPLLLLTEPEPRTFLRARVLAGLVVGLPVATAVPLATVAAGTAPPVGVAFAAAGVGLCLAATGLALGLGCAYPVHETREFWGVETVVPSTLVTICYTLVVLVGTALGLVVVRYGFDGSPALTAALGGVYLLPTVGVPLAGYAYARRRYRRYTLE